MEDLRAGITQDEEARVFAIIRELVAEFDRYGVGHRASCSKRARADLERSDFGWLSRGTYVDCPGGVTTIVQTQPEGVVR